MNFLKIAIFLKWCAPLSSTIMWKMKKIVRAILEKSPKNTIFQYLIPYNPGLRIFFKNRALSLLYPYGALTSCKKLEKSLEQSLRYLKTDYGQTTDYGLRTNMSDYIGPSRVNPGSKIRKILAAVYAVIMLYDTKNDKKTTKSQKKGSGYYCTAKTRIF